MHYQATWVQAMLHHASVQSRHDSIANGCVACVGELYSTHGGREREGEKESEARYGKDEANAHGFKTETVILENQNMATPIC